MSTRFVPLYGLLWVLLWACGNALVETPPVTLEVQVERGGQVHLGGGKVCEEGETCRWQFQRGSVVRLGPVPLHDYYFAGWIGPCTGFGECVFQISQETRVGARFSPIVGDYTIEPLPDPLLVPTGGNIEVGVGLQLSGGLDAPPGAYVLELESPLVGDGMDQVAWAFLPERSFPDRLLLAMWGPNPKSVGTYRAAPAQLRIRLGNRVKTLDFTLAVAPCLAGCGR